MNTLSGYVKLDVIFGLALMAALTVWELFGVFEPKWLTITAFIKSWMPMWARVPLWSWLGWHFILSDLVKKVGK
jgi:hypothetical protein